MRKVLIGLALLALTGCAHKTAHDWKDQARSAYAAALTKKSDYKGQTCTLRLEFNRSATLQKISKETGSAKLCNDAILAAQVTVWPPFPNYETYQTFKSFPLDLAF